MVVEICEVVVGGFRLFHVLVLMPPSEYLCIRWLHW